MLGDFVGLVHGIVGPVYGLLLGPIGDTNWTYGTKSSDHPSMEPNSHVDDPTSLAESTPKPIALVILHSGDPNGPT